MQFPLCKSHFATSISQNVPPAAGYYTQNSTYISRASGAKKGFTITNARITYNAF